MSLLFNVKNLSIRRAGIRILDGINWTVNAGEHWVDPWRQRLRQDLVVESAHRLHDPHGRLPR